MRIVLDLHGTKAAEGVEIDALETFLTHFRSALRELDRQQRGSLPRRGGRPDARDAAASAFRLVEFKTGSGIATLEPARLHDGDAADLALDDSGEDLSVTTLRTLVDLIDTGAERLPGPVVEALGSARRAIGENGKFGVRLGDDRQARRIVIDEKTMAKLRRPVDEETERTLKVVGRLHMIEAEPPARRVGIRAQDGIDWTCSYPDALHALVTQLIERLVRVEGHGRRLTPATGRLRLEKLDAVPEHLQDELFTLEPVPVEELRAQQAVARPQGLSALSADEWDDDDEANRRFLEATLGDAQP